MPNQYSNPWTEEQNDFLNEFGAIRDLRWLAKQLGRTEEAVQRQMERLGICDKHMMTGAYSALQLANELGIDSKTVGKWIKNKGLYAQQGSHFKEGAYQNKQKVVAEKHKPYFIMPHDFWKWAEKNRSVLNWHKVPMQALLPQPDWVAEQRKIDFHRAEKGKTLWTPEQDKTLWTYYYKDAVPQKEIAKRMGRTLAGVEKRLKRLREMKVRY